MCSCILAHEVRAAYVIRQKQKGAVPGTIPVRFFSGRELMALEINAGERPIEN